MRVPNVALDRFYWKERKDRMEEIRKLVRDFIKRRDKEPLVRLASLLWSTEAMKNKEWLVENRWLSDQTPDDLAEYLNKLIDESIPVEERLSMEVRGMGLKTLSEILWCFYPDKYPIFNRRSVDMLVKLRYLNSEVKDTPEGYLELVKASERFFSDMQHVKVKIEKEVGFDLPKFEFTDGLLNLIYEGKLQLSDIRMMKVVDIDEAMINYAVGSIPGAVKLYLHYLKRGDSEEEALEKAVNYALGMIESSGVLKDESKRRKFLFMLESMEGLISGLRELLERISL